MATLPTRMRGKGGPAGGSHFEQGGSTQFSPEGKRFDNPYFSEKSPFDPSQVLPKGIARWEQSLQSLIAYSRQSRNCSAFLVAGALHLALSIILQAESAAVRGGATGLLLFALQLPVGLLVGGTLAGALLVGAPAAMLTSAPQVLPWLHVALSFVANEWVALDHTLSEAPGGHIHLSSQDNCLWPCFRGLKRAFWHGQLGLLNLLLVLALTGLHSAFTAQQEQKSKKNRGKGGKRRSKEGLQGSGGYKSSPRGLKLRMNTGPSSPLGGNDSDKDQPGSFKLGADHDEMSPITYNAHMEKLLSQEGRGGRASPMFEIVFTVVLGWLCVSVLSTGLSMVQGIPPSGWVGHPVGHPLRHVIGVRSVRAALGVDTTRHRVPPTSHPPPYFEPASHFEPPSPSDHWNRGEKRQHGHDHYMGEKPVPMDRFEKGSMDPFETGASWRERERHAQDPTPGYPTDSGRRDEPSAEHHYDRYGEREDGFHQGEEHVGNVEGGGGAHYDRTGAVHYPHHDPATMTAGEGGFLEMADEWETYMAHADDHNLNEPLYREHAGDEEKGGQGIETPDGPQQFVHPEGVHAGHPDEAIHHGDHFDYEAGDAWQDFDHDYHHEEGEDWDDVDWEFHHTQGEDGAALHDPTKEESHGQGGHDPNFHEEVEEGKKSDHEAYAEESGSKGAEEKPGKVAGKSQLDVDAELLKKVYWPMYADMDMEKETEEEVAVLSAATKTLQEHCKKSRPNVVLLSIDSLSSHRTPSGNPSAIFDPLVAPALHALEAKHSIIFPEVYVASPSSLSTAIFLATGGVGPLSNPSEDEWGQYRGTTLPKVMQGMGWRTAYVSAEDTRGSSLDIWLQQQSYDWTATRDTKPELFADEMSQWGGTDDAAVDAALKFANDTAVGEPEFFIQLHLHATRHPYSVPSDWTSSLNETAEAETFAGVPSMIRFRRALQYTDHAVGRLVDGLEKLGLWNNTLFAITSNHGEAFGDPHEGNFLHGNFLFEENVKSFLILAHSDPAAVPHPIEVRNRPASIGDIFPTLMDLLGGPKDGRLASDAHPQPVRRDHAKWHEDGEENDPWNDFALETMAHDPLGRMVLGNDRRSTEDIDDNKDEPHHSGLDEVAPVRGRTLLTEHFQWRTIFFYKPGHSPEWGLRDGRWKFIGHRHHKNDELYDVVADSLEKLNLAKHYHNQTQQQVEIFHSRCDRWFDYIECAWLAHGACFRSYDQTDGEQRVAERKGRAQQRFPIGMDIGTGYGPEHFVGFPDRLHVPAGLPSIGVVSHWNPFPHQRILYFDLAPASVLSPTAQMHMLEGHDQPCWDQATAFPGACTTIHGGNTRWQVAFVLEKNWDALWVEIAVGGELTSGDWAISIWAEDGVTRMATVPFRISPHQPDPSTPDVVPETHATTAEGLKPAEGATAAAEGDSHKPPVGGTPDEGSSSGSEPHGAEKEGSGGERREEAGHGAEGSHGDVQPHGHEKEGRVGSGMARKGLVACGPPYDVRIGMIKNAEEHGNQAFLDVQSWNPMQDVITVQVSWPPCGVTRHVNYFFTSRLFPIPAWQTGTALNHTVESKYRNTWFWWKPDRPIAVDQWQLLIMEGNRVLARKPFYVDASAEVLF